MKLFWIVSATASIAAATALAQPAPTNPAAGHATAVFAGGCFWCMEEAFDKVPGVVETVSGYTGGTLDNPTYEQVTRGDTGHYEAVQVTYDPAQVNYNGLLDAFWRNVDPLQANGQFCDIGPSYKSAVFVGDDAARQAAEHTKAAVAEKLGQPVSTEILPAQTFYAAEGYHQDYYKKNAAKYKFYKWNCGRAQRLEELWGKSPGS